MLRRFAFVLAAVATAAFAAEPPVVSVTGRFLTVDHAPFFPIGLYELPDKRTDDAIWKETADAGFNFLLSEQSGRHGIYVSKPVPKTRLAGRRVSLMETYRDPALAAELRRWLAVNEADPTVLCWHAPDEPSWFGPSAAALEPGYQLIRAHSKKPVWLNVGPSFTKTAHYNPPADFLRTCDILSEDIYPIPDGQRKEGQAHNLRTYEVGEHTAALVNLATVAGAQARPIWMILQGFAWRDLTQFKNPPTHGPPTRHELRAMTYDAIIHGATGIIGFGPFGTREPANAQLWADVKSMAGELRRHYAVLTSPRFLMTDRLRVTAPDAGEKHPVRWLAKVLDDRVVVLACNTRPEPVPAVTFAPTANGRLTRVRVLDEERTIAVADGKAWADRFEGYAVHLYETDLYYPFMSRYHTPPDPR